MHVCVDVVFARSALPLSFQIIACFGQIKSRAHDVVIMSQKESWLLNPDSSETTESFQARVFSTHSCALILGKQYITLEINKMSLCNKTKAVSYNWKITLERTVVDSDMLTFYWRFSPMN